MSGWNETIQSDAFKALSDQPPPSRQKTMNETNQGGTIEKRFPALNDHLIRMASTGNSREGWIE